MSRELALSLLRQGNDGDSILQILESIAADESDAPNENDARWNVQF